MNRRVPDLSPERYPAHLRLIHDCNACKDIADTLDPTTVALLWNVVEAADRWQTWPAQAVDAAGHDDFWVAEQLIAALDALEAPR